MGRLHELDGFQLASGVLAVVAGPIHVLLRRASARGTFLIMGVGTLVLVAQWAIRTEITRRRSPQRT